MTVRLVCWAVAIVVALSSSTVHAAYIDFEPGLGDTFEARVSGSAQGGRTIFDFDEGGTAFADDSDFVGAAGVAGRSTMGNASFIPNGIRWDFYLSAEAGFGSASAFAQSGVLDGAVGGFPILWRIVPESEPVGTPFNVTFQATLSGTLTAEGTFLNPDSAEASWFMFADNTYVPGTTPVFENEAFVDAGSTEQSIPFSDTYSHTFQVLAGDTFELYPYVFVRANGNDDSASAYMEGTFSVLLEPVPIPATIWLFGSALGLLVWTRRRKA